MKAAVKIIEVLQQAGHVAYLAGGCVRDRLLGLVPEDYDVATDARPGQVRDLFRNTQFVGEAFGVVLVRLMQAQVEVATFRTEWGYTDKRRPDGVTFSDAEHDAQRRDFTINGLFEDPLTGQIVDYVAGQADLQSGLLRAIGDPDQRFNEDYLRLLRAVRFAARFGFEIETTTARAIRNQGRYLGQISRERIGQEVQKMLMQPPAKRLSALQWMQQLRLDGPTLHEDPLDVPLPTVEKLSGQADMPTCLSAWMIDRHARSGQDLITWMSNGATRTQTQWRKALSLSNEDRNAVSQILGIICRVLDWSALGVAGQKRLLSETYWPGAYHLIEALKSVAAIERLWPALEQEIPLLQAQGVNPDPWVRGEHLLAMGLTPGPAFGDWLDAVYDAQLNGTVCDAAEALDWIGQRIRAES